MIKSAGYILLIIILLSACRKRPDPVVTPASDNPQHTDTSDHSHNTEDTSKSLSMSFKNMVDGKDLIFNSEVYRTERGDSFTVSGYRYYISNISLERTDGTFYTEPESYHLIDQKKNESLSFALADIQDGTYIRLKFLVGVDSPRNVSGAQTGALDPKLGMFWTWSTGYIMSQLEGKVLVNGAEKPLSIHLGGFDMTNSVLQWVTLTLPKPVTVAKKKNPAIRLQANLAEWFRTPDVIDITKLPVIAKPGFEAQQIAGNYADMFTVQQVVE